VPYPLAFALTLLVEVPVYTVVLAGFGTVRPGRAAAAALVVNCATHPVLWWVLGRFAAGPAAAYWTAFALAEAAVCAIEALLLGRPPARPLRSPAPLPLPLRAAASLTANAASLLAGLLLATGR
jgi:hypothetical protein